MSTNTPAKSFGFGLVIDHRDSEPRIFILRDEETGAGHFMTVDALRALHKAAGECLAADDRLEERRLKSLASKAAA